MHFNHTSVSLMSAVFSRCRIDTSGVVAPVIFVAALAAAWPAHALPAENEYRHFYGICWDGGSPTDALRYAKQLAHHYIFYKSGMENDTNSRDMKFYLETPEYACYSFIPVPRYIDTTRTYTAQQISDYQKYFSVVNSNPFPFNMGRGWPSGRSFSVQPDFQQQAVIDYFVTKIIEYAKSKERIDKNFRFAGCAWDVPQLPGDFYYAGSQVTLSAWTGGDSSITQPGTTHEYRTHSDGHAAFYKKLKSEIKKIWPEAQFIVEPFDFVMYWLQDIAPRADKDTLVQDMFVTSEQWGTAFVQHPVFTATYYKGLLNRHTVGSSVPNAGDTEAHNRAIAGTAAIYGAWFNWFGRFNMPANTLRNLTHREKLIRVVPNWDNIAGVDSVKRVYNYKDSTYSSPNSRADGKVIYSRNPDNGKLFVIFLTLAGAVTLDPGETVLTAKRTDALLIETVDGMADLSVSNGTVTLTNAAQAGQCYVITTKNPSRAEPRNRSAAARRNGAVILTGNSLEFRLPSTVPSTRLSFCAVDGRVVAHRTLGAGETVRFARPSGVYFLKIESQGSATSGKFFFVQ